MLKINFPIRIVRYNLDDALTILVNDKKKRNFLESVEVSFHIKKGAVDLLYQDMATLPNPFGQLPKIAVLVSNETSDEEIEVYKSAGADIVGCDDLINSISQNTIAFNWLLSKPSTMPKLAPVGKILGPKRLMPSKKTETLVEDLESSIKEFRQGKFSIHSDKNGVVNIPFGKINFTKQLLKTNLLFLHEKIKSSCKNTSGNRHLKSVTISSTMGKGIKIRISDLP